jgi:hypothetical protein
MGDAPLDPAAPRGRLYQHDAFRSSDLRGIVIEEARCWHEKASAGDGGCSMLWLKPSGCLWQKFFLDAGVVFWEEWSDESTLATFDDLGDEVQPLDTVRGLEIGEIEAAPFGSDNRSGLRITLGRDGAICLLPADIHDVESPACLLDDLESPARLTIVLPTRS